VHCPRRKLLIIWCKKVLVRSRVIDLGLVSDKFGIKSLPVYKNNHTIYSRGVCLQAILEEAEMEEKILK
jgi:hypothetical protein